MNKKEISVLFLVLILLVSIVLILAIDVPQINVPGITEPPNEVRPTPLPEGAELIPQLPPNLDYDEDSTLIIYNPNEEDLNLMDVQINLRDKISEGEVKRVLNMGDDEELPKKLIYILAKEKGAVPVDKQATDEQGNLLFDDFGNPILVQGAMEDTYEVLYDSLSNPPYSFQDILDKIDSNFGTPISDDDSPTSTDSTSPTATAYCALKPECKKDDYKECIVKIYVPSGKQAENKEIVDQIPEEIRKDIKYVDKAQADKISNEFYRVDSGITDKTKIVYFFFDEKGELIADFVPGRYPQATVKAFIESIERNCRKGPFELKEPKPKPCEELISPGEEEEKPVTIPPPAPPSILPPPVPIRPTPSIPIPQPRPEPKPQPQPPQPQPPQQPTQPQPPAYTTYPIRSKTLKDPYINTYDTVRSDFRLDSNHWGDPVIDNSGRMVGLKKFMTIPPNLNKQQLYDYIIQNKVAMETKITTVYTGRAIKGEEIEGPLKELMASFVGKTSRREQFGTTGVVDPQLQFSAQDQAGLTSMLKGQLRSTVTDKKGWVNPVTIPVYPKGSEINLRLELGNPSVEIIVVNQGRCQKLLPVPINNPQEIQAFRKLFRGILLSPDPNFRDIPINNIYNEYLKVQQIQQRIKQQQGQ